MNPIHIIVCQRNPVIAPIARRHRIAMSAARRRRTTKRSGCETCPRDEELHKVQLNIAITKLCFSADTNTARQFWVMSTRTESEDILVPRLPL
jgi:hypothetical protein